MSASSRYWPWSRNRSIHGCDPRLSDSPIKSGTAGLRRAPPAGKIGPTADAVQDDVPPSVGLDGFCRHTGWLSARVLALLHHPDPVLCSTISGVCQGGKD